MRVARARAVASPRTPERTPRSGPGTHRTTTRRAIVIRRIRETREINNQKSAVTYLAGGRRAPSRVGDDIARCDDASQWRRNVPRAG